MENKQSLFQKAFAAFKRNFPKTHAKVLVLRDNKIKPTAQKIDSLSESKQTKEFNKASSPDIEQVRNNNKIEAAKKNVVLHDQRKKERSKVPKK